MLLDIAFLDDATRPTVPKLTGLRDDQRQAGEHLKEVHNHLRDNMRAIRALMQRAADGLASPADVAAEAGTLTMVTNFRRFGNLCGQHCQIVNTHHSIEDYHVFPALAAQSEGYARVTARLVAEVRGEHALQRLIHLARIGKCCRGRRRGQSIQRIDLPHQQFVHDDMLGCEPLGYPRIAFRLRRQRWKHMIVLE